MSFCISKYKDYLIVEGDNDRIFILNEELELLDQLKLDCSEVWDIKEFKYSEIFTTLNLF